MPITHEYSSLTNSRDQYGLADPDDQWKGWMEYYLDLTKWSVKQYSYNSYTLDALNSEKANVYAGRTTGLSHYLVRVRDIINDASFVVEYGASYTPENRATEAQAIIDYFHGLSPAWKVGFSETARASDPDWEAETAAMDAAVMALTMDFQSLPVTNQPDVFGSPAAAGDTTYYLDGLHFSSEGMRRIVWEDLKALENLPNLPLQAIFDFEDALTSDSTVEPVNLSIGGASGVKTYVWKRGGTTIGTGRNPTLSLISGTQTITLEVTDDLANTVTTTRDITMAGITGPDEILISTTENYTTEFTTTRWLKKSGVASVTVNNTTGDVTASTDTGSIVLRANKYSFWKTPLATDWTVNSTTDEITRPSGAANGQQDAVTEAKLTLVGDKLEWEHNTAHAQVTIYCINVQGGIIIDCSATSGNITKTGESAFSHDFQNGQICSLEAVANVTHPDGIAIKFVVDGVTKFTADFTEVVAETGAFGFAYYIYTADQTLKRPTFTTSDVARKLNYEKTIDIIATPPDTDPPVIDTFTATPVNSTTISVAYAASDVDGTVAGYDVEFSLTGATLQAASGTSGWTNLLNNSLAASPYSHTGRTPATTYYYRVRARDDAGTPNVSLWTGANATTQAALVITNTSPLTGGGAGVAWSADLDKTGGSGAGTWTIQTQGAQTVSIDGSTGVASIASPTVGSVTFTARFTDTNGEYVDKSFTVTFTGNDLYFPGDLRIDGIPTNVIEAGYYVIPEDTLIETDGSDGVFYMRINMIGHASEGDVEFGFDELDYVSPDPAETLQADLRLVIRENGVGVGLGDMIRKLPGE